MCGRRSRCKKILTFGGCNLWYPACLHGTVAAERPKRTVQRRRHYDAQCDRVWKLHAPNDERFRRLPCRRGKHESKTCMRRNLRVMTTLPALSTVHLEHVLNEINADGANLHVDDPLR
jgi:hypothetical protein